MLKIPAALVALSLLTAGGARGETTVQPVQVGQPARVAASYGDYVRSSLEGYIRPAMGRFASDAARLPDAVQGACAAGDDSAREEFRAVYGATLASFARIGFLRFGPLAEANRLERLAFLPDARGVAQRQVRRILADRDPTAATAEQLAGKSVAVQGLTALQLVAFDEEGRVTLGGTGDPDAAFSCAYALAIAGNVASLAGDLARDWADPAGFSGELLAPGPDRPLLKSDKEAAELIFNAIVTGFVIVRDQDLLPALGSGPDSAKPGRLPFARSGFTLAYLSAEISGLAEALKAGSYERGLDSEGTWIPASLEFEFGNALKALARLREPMRVTLAEPETHAGLSYVALVLKGLRDTVALNLAGSLNLSGGFNALDGD
ncbi:imelysin family protein [Pannonibacter tanglangensis]|uniref:Imelysin-like domain-containing protein n=1 Tax=Pannonibacter tanglangensis TaxID=2750084 RepID=A0ABW9ZM19_9HYPH|nr:imelysin family protein [Pannonibacter sp. XCT-34]NBN65965.1 hypothetical protein [Pannonibacter sp. XCT-34]